MAFQRVVFRAFKKMKQAPILNTFAVRNYLTSNYRSSFDE